MKIKKILLLPFILVFLDQITKSIFQNKTYMINGIGIENATNTGAAFGIFQGQNLILALISVVIIIAISSFYRKSKWLVQLGLLFVLSGAIGNLIDRILFGYVRDFIAVYWWPNFNLADSFNVIGIILIIWAELKYNKKP